jgi:hypothetical protein
MNILPIKLPPDTITKVKKGDKIRKGQLLAQTSSSENEIINLSLYHIPGSKFTSSLKKHLGDSVTEGEIVAVKKKIFGSVKIKSPFTGTLVKIDEENQSLYLKPKDFSDKKDLLSPVDGVVEFCDNTKLSIKTDGYVIPAEDVLGESVSGHTLAVEEKIDKSVEGKIVLKESFDKLGAFKSFGLGALGILTTKLEDFDFIDLGKDFDKTIALVSNEDYKKLIKKEDKNISIDAQGKIILV